MAINVSLEMNDTFNQWVEKINSLADQANIEIENLSSSTAPVFTGATETNDGSHGLVLAPTTNDVNKFLKSDGTWSEEKTTLNVSRNSVISNTEYGLLYSSVEDTGGVGELYTNSKKTYYTDSNNKRYISFNKIIGNVNRVTKAKKVQLTANGYSYDCSDNLIQYGECLTAGNNKNKIVNTNTLYEINGNDVIIKVKFLNNNIASNITLNVNGAGDWPIVQSYGGDLEDNIHKITPSRIKANHIYYFVSVKTYTDAPLGLRNQTLWYMIGGSDITANHFDNLVSTPEILGIQTASINNNIQFAIKSESYLNTKIAYYEVRCTHNSIEIIPASILYAEHEYTPMSIVLDSQSFNIGEQYTIEVVAVDTLGNKSKTGVYNFTAM